MYVTSNVTTVLNEVLTSIRSDGLEARLSVRDETPLIWAVSEGYPEIAKQLIRSGADLDARNSDGNTALLRASCEGRTDLASALINAGALLDLQNNDGYSALILAQRRGNIDIVDILGSAGANPALKTNMGTTVDSAGDSPKVSLQGHRDDELESWIIRAVLAALP